MGQETQITTIRPLSPRATTTITTERMVSRWSILRPIPHRIRIHILVRIWMLVVWPEPASVQIEIIAQRSNLEESLAIFQCVQWFFSISTAVLIESIRYSS